MLLFQVCNFLGMSQQQMYITRYYSKLVLQLYTMQAMTQQTLLYLHPAAQIHVNSSRVMSCSVQKSLITPHTANTIFRHTNDCEEISDYCFCNIWQIKVVVPDRIPKPTTRHNSQWTSNRQ
jgi:hypothetical protein